MFTLCSGFFDLAEIGLPNSHFARRWASSTRTQPALAPMVARRAFGPLGLALAGGWAAKKYYDTRKLRTGYRASSGRS